MKSPHYFPINSLLFAKVRRKQCRSELSASYLTDGFVSLHEILTKKKPQWGESELGREENKIKTTSPPISQRNLNSWCRICFYLSTGSWGQCSFEKSELPHCLGRNPGIHSAIADVVCTVSSYSKESGMCPSTLGSRPRGSSLLSKSKGLSCFQYVNEHELSPQGANSAAAGRHLDRLIFLWPPKLIECGENQYIQ